MVAKIQHGLYTSVPLNKVAVSQFAFFRNNGANLTDNVLLLAASNPTAIEQNSSDVRILPSWRS